MKGHSITPEQITQLYLENYNRFLLHAKRITKRQDIAEDVLQTAVTKVLSMMRSGELDRLGVKNIEAYMMQVVRNHSLNLIQREKRYDSHGQRLENLRNEAGSILGLIDSDDDLPYYLSDKCWGDIKNIIAHSSKQEQLLFELWLKHGRDNVSIGARMGITADKARSKKYTLGRKIQREIRKTNTNAV